MIDPKEIRRVCDIELSGYSEKVMRQAADEIERLRAALEQIATQPLTGHTHTIAQNALRVNEQQSDISYAEVPTEQIQKMNEYAKGDGEQTAVNNCQHGRPENEVCPVCCGYT